MDRVLREQVRQRAGLCCEYCRMPQECIDAVHEVDHIIAEKHRGPSSLENLDRWQDHFEYHGAMLIGLTPVAKATIAVLEINLRHRIDHRQGLVAEGVLPPL